MQSKDTEKKSPLLPIIWPAIEQIYKKLQFSHTEYCKIFTPAMIQDHKKYYIYSVLGELEKSCFNAFRIEQLVEENSDERSWSEKHGTKKRMKDNLVQSIIDEIVLWHRKQTEVMIDLIGFRNANEQKYYRHYLLLHNLTDLRRQQKDIKEFYDAPNYNYEQQEQILERVLNNLRYKLDPAKCWYAEVKNGDVKNRLITIEKRFKNIAPRMSPQEQAIMRTFYTSFETQSASMHISGIMQTRKCNLQVQDIDRYLSRLIYVDLNLAVNIGKLVYQRTVGALKTCSMLLRDTSSTSESLHNTLVSPPIEENDFVIAHDSIAQVIEVIISKYGYKSFKVEFIDPVSKPSPSTDYVIGELVKIYYKYKDLMQGLKNLGIEIDTPEQKKELQSITRKTIIEAYTGRTKLPEVSRKTE